MDGDAPKPIEVELVAHDALSERGGGRRRREPPEPLDESPDEPPSDGADRNDRSDRSRLVLVAAVCAVLALVLGWMIGRSTGGTDSVADDVPDATVRTTTTLARSIGTLPIVGEEIDGADFESEEPVASIAVGPTESVPTESETAEPGAVTGPTIEAIGVDDRLADAPIRLVGVELGGVLVEADLAAGTLTEVGADRLSTDGLPLVVGDDWVLASRFGRAAVVRSDGTVSEIDVGDRWDVLHVPGTELFWRAPSAGPRERDDAVVLSLVDLAGEPVGPTLELPALAWPYAVDPLTGGVVVNGFPRNYVVRPDGIDYLGVGTLVALTPDVVVFHDCDELLVCSLFVVDRETGAATPVPVDPELDLPPVPFAGRFGSPPQLSPDGRWVPVVDAWWSSTTGIVELSTGRFVPLTDDPFSPTVAWSPDGRFAIVLDDQEVIAYDTVTDERFAVFTDTARWVQLGVRPPDVVEPAADGPTLLSASPEEPVEG